MMKLISDNEKNKQNPPTIGAGSSFFPFGFARHEQRQAGHFLLFHDD
jgi:hypothetical protein